MRELSLEQYSQTELQEMSLIELAFELLESKKQGIPFKEILDELTKILGLSEEEVRAKISQFYTDLNLDGRFLALGENTWGLRVWYPIDQIEEEVVAISKPKRKKGKKKDLEEEDYDLEEDFDDLDEFDDNEDEEDLEDESDIEVDDVLEDDLDDTDDEIEEDVIDEEFEIDEEDDLDEEEDFDELNDDEEKDQ
ncbi:DNA-directed RNA polymerase subunit delta [Bacillus sp. 03113]|uniref:DNA-directed RNA polymerase subunit delta n=1 Tax=Bacillus sp. 03113 TaxID=2578211 RepID=UPI002852E2B9|nr:DNA-directed RNA polymerase subunit delta [Bacillus sp. 03113]